MGCRMTIASYRHVSWPVRLETWLHGQLWLRATPSTLLLSGYNFRETMGCKAGGVLLAPADLDVDCGSEHSCRRISGSF